MSKKQALNSTKTADENLLENYLKRNYFSRHVINAARPEDIQSIDIYTLGATDYAIEGMNQTYIFKQYLSKNTIPVFNWNEEYLAGIVTKY